MTRHARTAAVGLILAALALAGCSGEPQRAQVGPHFVTAPLVYLSTVLWPPPLSLVGLTPGSRIQLEARVDAPGGRWESDATYTVPSTGIIDLNAVRPQLAPFGTPDSAGLIWSLQGPDLAPDAAARLWTESTVGVHIAAVDDGRVVASTVLELAGLGTVMTPLVVLADELGGTPANPSTAEDDSPAGLFYDPRGPFHPQAPAVIVFDDDSTGASEPYVGPLLALFGIGVFVVPVERAADQVHVSSTYHHRADRRDHRLARGRSDVDPRSTSSSTVRRSRSSSHSGRPHTSAPASTARSGPVARPRSSAGRPKACRRSSMHRVRCRANATANTVDDFERGSLAGIAGPVVLACTRSDEILPSACGLAGRRRCGTAEGTRTTWTSVSTARRTRSPFRPVFPSSCLRCRLRRRPNGRGSRSGSCRPDHPENGRIVTRRQDRPRYVTAAVARGGARDHAVRDARPMPERPGTRFVIGQLNASTTDPVTISIVGLQPGLDVTVEATVDEAGEHWRSRAIYPVLAQRHGRLLPRLDRRWLLIRSADASGLLWSLEGPSQSQAQLERTWADGDVDIVLTASEGGHVVATARIHRPGLAGFASVTPVFAGDVVRNAIGKPMGGTAYDLRIGTFYRPVTLVDRAQSRLSC